MTIEYIVGGLTIASALAVKVIGYPAQIRQIQTTKSVDGVSLILSIVSVFAYLCWTIHGILENDKVLIFGQGLGVIVSSIFLGQVLYYRRKRNGEQTSR